MKSDNIIVGAIAVFFAGVMTGMSARGDSLGVFMQAYLPAVATLVAAYAGAARAFHLSTTERLEKEKRANILAGEKALFNLIRQYNELYVFKRKFIDPVHGKPGAFFLMEPVHKKEHDDLHFDIDSLFFLFERDRNILMRLTIEEARFHEAIKCINDRSSHHMTVIQPSLAAAGVKDGDGIESDQIEKIVGNYAYVVLKRLAAAVVGHVEMTLDSHRVLFNDMHAVLSAVYPEHRFSKFTPRQDV